MLSGQDFQIQVKTFYGLETVLAEEVKKLGGRKVEVKNRAVTCEGDLGFLYKVNYSCRLALRVLVPLFTFKAFNEKRFYEKLYAFDWTRVMDADQRFAIDATVYSETFSHSRYMVQKMKDAIVDHFLQNHRRRPTVETRRPDIQFHLHIDRELVTISLDSSGEPLFKRGYRKESTQAPINEVLAAGMLSLAGWDGKGNFLDPMCGSGTLCIEAAMMALGLPAQIFRSEFAFQNWKNYDNELFQTIKAYRIQRIKDTEAKIYGYDLDATAVCAAKANVEAAELEELIDIQQRDFFETKKEHFPLLMVFNPPYDERIKLWDTNFYKKIGDTFKQGYPNTLAWIISSDLEKIKEIGLRPSRKIKLFNGKLECRFQQYEMYEGTKKVHRMKSLDED